MPSSEFHPGLPSRREILSQAGCIGAAYLLAGSQTARAARNIGTTSAPSASQPTTQPASTRPSSAVPAALKSVVSDIRARQVVADSAIHEELLREIVEEGVREVTGAASPGEAWNKLLRSDDVIGIKFNHIGEEVINTSLPMAVQLVESLKSAGFSPDRIILIEAPWQASRRLKTRPCPVGFAGPKVSFGSGEDELAAVLQEVSAIINVPFLKTHNLAGMSCCLKNLSHALIRRPKLCHASACSPFVGDILALPQIRPKLKIHIVNALRAVFDGGPVPDRKSLWTHSGVLVSTDPVACDKVALDILNEQRATRKLPVIGNLDGQIPHVHAAAAHGLGTDDQDYIEVQRPNLF
jgi:uncharacterized protein (DUF362 family)